jgi:RimJ/RimL family protein N-acetyltransferase
MTSLDLQPHLVGALLELRPLRPDDWDALFAAASDPLIWSGHPARDRYKEEVFRDFFREALEGCGAFVAIDRATGRVIGSSRYFWYGENPPELEIGWTFLVRDHWGGRYNAEMKRLMLAHAFQSVDHVVFLVGADNIRSRKAMAKIGGVLRDGQASRTLHGQTSEFVIFEITADNFRTGPLAHLV